MFKQKHGIKISIKAFYESISIGIEFVDQESISIVSVSEKVVSKGSDMHAPDCTGAMTSNSFALHVRRKYFVN